MAEKEMTVMVVDDSVYLINKLKNIFEKNGFKVVSFTNGQEAIGQYAVIRPDMVMLDIVMPGMDGLQVFGELKKIDADVKVVMVSSIAMKGKITAAVQLGAKNFIVKPFEEEKVMEIVNRILRVAG